jgi:hypothetical protein
MGTAGGPEGLTGSGVVPPAQTKGWFGHQLAPKASSPGTIQPGVRTAC